MAPSGGQKEKAPAAKKKEGELQGGASLIINLFISFSFVSCKFMLILLLYGCPSILVKNLRASALFLSIFYFYHSSLHSSSLFCAAQPFTNVWVTIWPPWAATHFARFFIPRQHFFNPARKAGSVPMFSSSRAAAFISFVGDPSRGVVF